MKPTISATPNSYCGRTLIRVEVCLDLHGTPIGEDEVSDFASRLKATASSFLVSKGFPIPEEP